MSPNPRCSFRFQARIVLRDTYLGWILRAVGAAHFFDYNDEEHHLHHQERKGSARSGISDVEERKDPYLVAFEEDDDLGVCYMSRSTTSSMASMC